MKFFRHQASTFDFSWDVLHILTKLCSCVQFSPNQVPYRTYCTAGRVTNVKVNYIFTFVLAHTFLFAEANDYVQGFSLPKSRIVSIILLEYMNRTKLKARVSNRLSLLLWKDFLRLRGRNLNKGSSTLGKK